MNAFLSAVENINGVVYNFIWGLFGVALLVGTGILMTCLTGGFQITRIGHWFRHTIGSVLKKDSAATQKNDKHTISQFQALCTALAATIGTGNIAGVATAIVVGGPGAVFWMWVAAFFGMMTKFSENVLAIYFRRRNKNGEWSGGAMYYLKDGLGKKKGMRGIAAVLAVLFAVFTILASFGIGNMGQINTIVTNLQSTFFADPAAPLGTVAGIPVVTLLLGAALMLLAALIVLGGLQRIAAVTERIVPTMALLYIVGALVLIAMNASLIGDAFAAIFRFALGTKALVGGTLGAVIQSAMNTISKGCSRGVFSNEAGLGSAALVHSSANVKEPVRQGMWGIFEVFVDTLIVCSVTALVILTSGAIDLSSGLPVSADINADTASTLVSRVFGAEFGFFGQIFIAVALLLFAFTTVLGWSQYGIQAAEYLFGAKGAKVYRVVFVLTILPGAVLTNSLAWDISDTFNGLMMIPNLIGVVALSPLVMKITKNYVNRRLKGKREKPLLSYDPVIDWETAKALDRDGD